MYSSNLISNFENLIEAIQTSKNKIIINVSSLIFFCANKNFFFNV